MFKRRLALPFVRRPRFAAVDPYYLLLFLAIGVYIVIFSQLAFAQHLGMRTHKADLGQIDQAVWNSSRGRFVEMTDNGFVATRMTDHVEPILALISPIFWLWDDVRALLLLQVVAVALGAWPLYALALRQLDRLLSPQEQSQIWHWEPLRQMTRPMALALALAYLLAPQLQSALLTEFHAAPLAVPLILWAFWAIAAERWGQFVVATLLVALVKEEMALLAAGLGLWSLVVWELRVAIHDLRLGWARWRLWRGWLSLGVMLAALGWFYVATFVVVPAHAVQVYANAESVYFGRYGALGNSPTDIFKSFFTQPALVWQIATEPARLHYLWGLLAPFGLLSLIAPEIILLSLPLLLANLLSAYPAQYYGEFHYSAPLVPYFAVSAAYGLGRLWRWLGHKTARTSGSYQHLAAAGLGTMAMASLFTNARTALRPLIALTFTIWLLVWAIVTYTAAGRGPWAARYDPTPITAHDRLLAHFVAQLPPDAAVTATAAVHPHVSHRRYVYQFPLGVAELGQPGAADWALLDVTTNTDMAPGDLKAGVETMLAEAWGVVDGADGFLLLHRGAPSKTIPSAFYDFSRSAMSRQSTVTIPPQTTLQGITVDDWPRWRLTKVNATWQVGADFDAAHFQPCLDIVGADGELLYTLSQATPPALIWYPPSAWHAGEVVQITTLALTLPRLWAVPLVGAGKPLCISQLGSNLADARATAAFVRTNMGKLQQLHVDHYTPLLATQPILTGVAQLQGADMANPLTVEARLNPTQLWPGGPLLLWLTWRGATNWPTGYQVFVHVRRGEETVMQQDGAPRFFTPTLPAPTDATLTDLRLLTLPTNWAGPQQVTVVIGLYDPTTGQRAMVLDQQGNPMGNEWSIGTLPVGAPPLPDQACALIPATCASQPMP
ncbi:MAG: DUF2079 domain-containing protein [Caldilineaceae bacterium]